MEIYYKFLLVFCGGFIFLIFLNTIFEKEMLMRMLIYFKNKVKKGNLLWIKLLKK